MAIGRIIFYFNRYVVSNMNVCFGVSVLLQLITDAHTSLCL